MTQTCRSCGATLEPDEQFCSECGAASAPTSETCPSCGREVKAGARFCGGCGRALGVPAPASTVPNPTRSRPPRPTRLPLLAGVVLTVLGGFLPWLSLLDVRQNAWRISVTGVLLGGRIGRGLAVGPILLLSAVALLPRVRRAIVLAVGLLVVVLAVLAAVRGYGPYDLGPGLLVTGAGGLAIVLRAAASRAEPEGPVPVAAPPVSEPAPATDDLEYVRPLPQQEQQEPPPPEPDAGWVLRPREPSTCPSCGAQVSGAFCGTCGSRVG